MNKLKKKHIDIFNDISSKLINIIKSFENFDVFGTITSILKFTH